MVAEQTERFRMVVSELAKIGVDSTVHYSGGNILNIRVVDPYSGRWTVDFGMEPGDVVGYDVTIRGDCDSSGDISTNSDAHPEVIASAIGGLISSMRFADFRASGRDVASIGVEIDAPDMEGRSGRIYLDRYWIGRRAPWGWYTVVGNCEYASTDLEMVEKDLFYFQVEDQSL